MRHNDRNKISPPPSHTHTHTHTHTPCHMRHSQNFDKIDSFLKPVLNNFILGNLMGEEVIKERAGIPKNTFYDLLVKILHLENKST